MIHLKKEIQNYYHKTMPKNYINIQNNKVTKKLRINI